MKKVRITSDSTADLDRLFAERDIPVLPLEVLLGERTGLDGVEIRPEDIYKYYADTKCTPKTSAVSPERYYEFFKKFTDEGCEVVHFTISSDMSACYSNACKAAAELEGVYVIDSMNLSTGIGLQVLFADDLAREGVPAEDIALRVNARRSSVQASFVVDTMDFLYRGGRCSGVSAFIASVLRIRPSIFVKDGKMGVGKKYMGATSKAILKYVNDTVAAFNDPDKKYVFITHSSSPAEVVEAAKKEVLAVWPDANIIETVAGSTVTSHCGKGTLGVLYYNDGGRGRQENT